MPPRTAMFTTSAALNIGIAVRSWASCCNVWRGLHGQHGVGYDWTTSSTRFKRKEKPLVVLDEADKLSDQVLYFFISLYNQLEGHCGIILCATNFWISVSKKRAAYQTQGGTRKIYSRIGRKFVELQVVNSEDIAAICVANGITTTNVINRIVEDCECDLRRVKRAIWALQKKGGQE